MTETSPLTITSARAAMSAHRAGGTPDPAVMKVIEERQITEVVHFTTNLGLIGTLGLGLLLSRHRLPEERYLEHVYKPNSTFRKDTAWLDFVNMSISNVNDWMFSTSSRWHEDDGIWWTILAFDPAILAAPGVVFATTNNIYPRCLRYQGACGIEALFADPVFGRYDSRHTRSGKSSWQPTDRQAEVLIPESVSVRHLETIYVAHAEHADAIEGLFGGLGCAEYPIVVDPGVFA